MLLLTFKFFLGRVNKTRYDKQRAISRSIELLFSYEFLRSVTAMVYIDFVLTCEYKFQIS